MSKWRSRSSASATACITIRDSSQEARSSASASRALCDEPTGDLDRKSGDEILDLLQALNRDQGKTIVMVTHDPHAAARAKRTLHLDKGVLVREAVA